MTKNNHTYLVQAQICILCFHELVNSKEKSNKQHEQKTNSQVLILDIKDQHKE